MQQDSKLLRPVPNIQTKHPILWETAKCRGMGDTLFFDPLKTSEQKARNICSNGCPISTDCLMYGMTQAFGTWGGVTEQERRTIRAKKRFVKCGQCGRIAVNVQHSAFAAEICYHCGVWWTKL